MMKHAMFLVLTSILCCLSCVFAGEFTTYTSPTFNFDIRYPQEWEIKQISGIVVFLSPLDSQNDTFRENVNVVVEDLGSNRVTVEQYVKAADDVWMRSDSTLKFENAKKTKLNGEDAFYTIAVNEKIKYKQYKLVKNNQAFIITYTSEPEKFNQFLNIAETIMASFKIK
jgi:eukaryotic-like serine/threonine-protein kinase